MLEAGIRTFMDLTEPHETGGGFSVETGYQRLLWQLSEERGLEVTRGMIPIPDHDIPAQTTMRCILDVLDSSITGQSPVHVHCFMGIGRTGTVVGCYLRRHRLATAREVVDKIMLLRSSIPENWGPSPHMPAQIKMVQGWREGE